MPQTDLYPLAASHLWPRCCVSKSCTSNEQWCTCEVALVDMKKVWWSTGSAPRSMCAKTATIFRSEGDNDDDGVGDVVEDGPGTQRKSVGTRLKLRVYHFSCSSNFWTHSP